MAADDSRYFFVHVMKTGGTTFRSHVRANFAIHEIYPNRIDDPDMDTAYLEIARLRSQSPQRIRQTRCFAAHLPFFVVDELDSNITVLTILRDPVERALSHLQQIRTARMDPKMTLEEAYDADPVWRNRLQNLQTRTFALRRSDDAENIMAPIDIDSARLDEAKHNLDRVDVVGLSEDFTGFLRRLEANHGWTVADVPNLRVSDPRPTSDSFRERLRSDNWADVALYEHARSSARS